jgi:hypothetical protein
MIRAVRWSQGAPVTAKGCGMRAGRWLQAGRVLTVGVLVAAGLLAMHAAQATWSATFDVSAAGW